MTAVPASSSPTTAFFADAATFLTTHKLFAYARKLAAVQNHVYVSAFGLPKISTKSFSVDICVLSKTGPHWNPPAHAPIVVATFGTTAVPYTHLTLPTILLV